MTQRQAFFLPAEKGQRFCIFSPSQLPEARGAILYLHPFAEELNLSRRTVALQTRALAAAGFDVLQIDLLGCGDSSGAFEDATWTHWLADAQLALAWLQANSAAPLWLWGLRSGALLAADLARQSPLEVSLLYWQPIPSGDLVLRDFQRLAVAGELLSGSGKARLAEFKASLAADMPIDVAGYTLSSAMAKGLAESRLIGDQGAFPKRLGWIEIVSSPKTEPSSVVAQSLARMKERGGESRYAAVTGQAFWQSHAIDIPPGLIEQTLRVVTELSCA